MKQQMAEGFLTNYVVILSLFYQRKLSSDWSEEDLDTTFQKNGMFTILVCEGLDDCLPSKMGTQNWHALDHLCNSITDMSGIT